MTLKELALWQQREYTGMKPGLERVSAFLEAAGRPQDSFRAIHVAGTNGKGATAKMIAAMCARAGLKTGLYVSPHLVSMRERISAGGREITAAELGRLSSRYRPLAEKHGLTFFEFITGIAFVYFAERGIDTAVLETGLGGRFDATNVVERPLACVITDIAFDHEAVLGGTVRKIAFEKAGIIKPGCPAVCSAGDPDAVAVIAAAARRMKAPLFVLGRDFRCSALGENWRGGFQRVRYSGLDSSFDAKLSMMGTKQPANCGAALAVMELLSRKGLVRGAKEASKALASVKWPGRLDARRIGSRTLLIDGAHNPGAVKALLEALGQSPWGGRKTTLIFGMLRDKDYREAISLLSRAAGRVILTPVDSPRAASTAELAAEWRKYLPESRITEAGSPEEALRSVKNEKFAVAAGSLYLAGQILKILTKRKEC